MTSEAQLDEFIDKYTPEMAQQARQILAKMREMVPPCIELVYDNYNGLVVGFCPDPKPSSGIFSILVLPKWATLCFLQGAAIDDPYGLLSGEGNVVRHIRLAGGVGDLDKPEIRHLMDLAMAMAPKRFPDNGKRELVIQSVSAKQRPRRPK
jgi:hypothetical protein